MDKKLLDALAAKAEQRKADKAKVIQFKVGGQLLDFVKIGHTAQLDAYEAFIEASGNVSTSLSVAAQVIYDCCPALQDPELHAALGITDPYDTVWALMSVREVNVLAQQIFAWLELLPEDENAKAEQDPAKN